MRANRNGPYLFRSPLARDGSARPLAWVDGGGIPGALLRRPPEGWRAPWCIAISEGVHAGLQRGGKGILRRAPCDVSPPRAGEATGAGSASFRAEETTLRGVAHINSKGPTYGPRWGEKTHSDIARKEGD